MSTAISLNGGWISRSISFSDIEKIKNAKNIDDVSSVWDQIKDWFCGTNKESAKKELFKLLNPTTTFNEKKDAFNNLKSMAGAAHEEDFIVGDNGELKIVGSGNTIFSLAVKKGEFGERECKSVSESITGEVTKEGKARKDIDIQFKKDIGRGDYYVNGVKINASEFESKEEQLEKKFNLTPEIEMCLSQTLLGAAFGFLFDKNVGADKTVFGATGVADLRYDITLSDGGVISVKATSEKDVAFALEKDIGKLEDFLSDYESGECLSYQKVEIEVEINPSFKGVKVKGINCITA